MTGDYNSNDKACDLTIGFLNGAAKYGVYQGQRDQALAMATSLMNNAVLGLLVQSAYLTSIKTSSAESQSVQD